MDGPARRTAVLTVVLVAAVTACSSAAKPRAHPRVGFVVANAQLNFATEMADGFRAGVGQVGRVEQTVVGPPIVDGPHQVQMFQEMAKETWDGIGVFTLSPELFAAPMAEAVRRGIPMVAVDNPPPPASGVTLFVGNDNYRLGRSLGEEIAGGLPAGATGKVIIGTAAPGVRVLDRRADGVRDELRERFPAVTVLGPFDSKQDVAANLVAWQTLVRANPDALAFIGTGDADGWNLVSIRRSTHGTWLAGAFDLDLKALDGVKGGDLVLASPEHFVKGAVAGRLLAEHARDGRPLPEGWIYTPGLVVNRRNIDEIIARQASLDTKRAWFAPVVERILHDRSYLRPLSQAG
jgi:ribose transport system substrate-binding protein